MLGVALELPDLQGVPVHVREQPAGGFAVEAGRRHEHVALLDALVLKRLLQLLERLVRLREREAAARLPIEAVTRVRDALAFPRSSLQPGGEHLAVAGLTGLVTIALVSLSWLRLRDDHRVMRAAMLAFVLICVPIQELLIYGKYMVIIKEQLMLCEWLLNQVFLAKRQQNGAG